MSTWSARVSVLDFACQAYHFRLTGREGEFLRYPEHEALRVPDCAPPPRPVRKVAESAAPREESASPRERYADALPFFTHPVTPLETSWRTVLMAGLLYAGLVAFCKLL